MSILSKLLEQINKNAIALMQKQIEQERKDVEEFRRIDFGRLLFDKEYQQRLDEHFDKGWESRIKWDWRVRV